MKTGKRKRDEVVSESSKRKRAAEWQGNLSWDRSKPVDMSDLKWRRSQIKRHPSQNPDHKGKKILAQIRKQKPDSWPDADVRSLNPCIQVA